MSNNLEKFIQVKKEEFDSADPSDSVWKNIEQSLSKRKKTKRFFLPEIYKWSAIAALIAITVTSIYFLFIKKYSHERQVTKTGTQGNPYDISSIAPEYSIEFNQAYQSVKSMQKELQSATSDQPQLYLQFLKDLSTLDSSYLLLKKQIVLSPNRDAIIKAMLQNLQLQAELLNRQFLIFNQFKNEKKSKNETSI